ncbi:MAG TPA: YkgJ family cysteine cluster protein [Chloroflexota bacterium]|nr:YkgJ family cysteine cluster protein [Chloroflexota bacterium]
MSAVPSAWNPCATCGECCRNYIVSVCGYDVWQICARERLSPERFLIVCPQDEPRRDSFFLQHGGQAYGLMLDKKGPLKAKRPCVFLMQLGGGHDRCGIYDHRPVVCQAYPMGLTQGDVTRREGVLCPADAWTAGEVRRPAWRRALQRQRLCFDVYRQVVLRWNARVSHHPGARFAIPEYFTYLLNVYDGLARLDGDVGPDAMSRVEASWGVWPDAARAAAATGALSTPPLRIESAPWLSYLHRVKEILDRFYPGVAPQPLTLPAPSDDESRAPQAMSA